MPAGGTGKKSYLNWALNRRSRHFAIVNPKLSTPPDNREHGPNHGQIEEQDRRKVNELRRRQSAAHAIS